MTTPPHHPADATDPELVQWQQAFLCIIHPALRPLSTLIEMEDPLAAANGYLQTLDADDEKQVARGIAVALMAVDYADKLLDHFGFWDGPPPPKPTTLERARFVVGNLLTFVRDKIRSCRLALASGAELHTTDEEEVSATAPSANFIVDRATFSVGYGGKSCSLGNSKEFQLIERLHRTPGNYLSVATLIDEVWDGDDPEKNTVQKTVSNLRKKLAASGITGATIDGSERDHYALILR